MYSLCVVHVDSKAGAGFTRAVQGCLGAHWSRVWALRGAEMGAQAMRNSEQYEVVLRPN